MCVLSFLSEETTFKADASQDQSPKDFTFPKAMPTLRHLGWASTATSALAALKQTRKVEDVTSPQSRGQSTPRGDMDQNESSLKEEDVRKLVKFALWVLFNESRQQIGYTVFVGFLSSMLVISKQARVSGLKQRWPGLHAIHFERLYFPVGGKKRTQESFPSIKLMLHIDSSAGQTV